MRHTFNPSMPPLTFKKIDNSDSDEESIYGPGIWQPNGRIHYDIKQMDVAIQIAKNQGLNSLIFEPSGESHIFFKYKAQLCEFYRSCIGVKIGHITKD